MNTRAQLKSYTDIEHHEPPFKIEYRSNEALLVILGTRHTFNPEDRSLEYIEKEFSDFAHDTNKRRTVIVEGGLRGKPTDRESAVLKHGGEGGLVTFLAQENNITIDCYEPDLSEIHQEAAQKYPKDIVALSHISDIAFQYHNENKPATPLEYSRFFLEKLNSSLEESYSIDKINIIASKLLGFSVDLFENKEAAYTLADPIGSENPIREVAEAITLCRDAKVLDSIIQNHQKGTSQFVVYGNSHVDIWRPVLLEVLA